MDLEKIQVDFVLPEEVVTFCRENNLLDIEAIRQYEVENNTFMALPGCSELIEDRLLGLLTMIPPLSPSTTHEVPTVLLRNSPDLSLKEISAVYGLSVRAYNVCEAAGLLHISDLRDFAKRNGDFRKLRNCGIKTQLELISLLARLPVMGGHSGADPDLNELSKQFSLSARAQNICVDADLHTLSDIRNYAKQHGGFRGLRNCGKKTELELNALLERTRNASTPVVALPRPQDQSLAGIISSFVHRLSAPATEALLKHARSIDPGAVYNSFGIHDGKMPEFLTVASEVKIELLELRANILMALKDSETPVGPEREQQEWCLRNQIHEELAAILFNADGHPHVLRFLGPFLQHVSKPRMTGAYSPLLRGMDPPGTMEEVGRSAGLTRERVRQLMQVGDRWILGKIALVEDLPGARAYYAELTTDADWLSVSTVLAMWFNQREGTDWSPRFFGYLAQVLNSHRIKLVKWESLFDRKSESRKLDHQHPLLVADQLVVPLHTATKQAKALFSSKRGREEQVPLHRLAHPDRQQADERVVGLLREILPLRYQGSRVLEDVWCIAPNAKLKQEEMLEDVLAALNEPSHASRISDAWNIHYPGHPISMGGIRSVAVRNKAKFFSIGRTSTYGLRKWEAERPVKGGTIRDMVEELLMRRATTVHMRDALDEVRRYRPSTSLSSMRQNLKAEASGRFQFMKNGYIGLAGRVYGDVPEQPFISGTLFRTTVLAKFIGKPRESLVAYIASRTNATVEQVDRKIKNIVESGRLQISPSGIITSVRSTTTGEGFGELPLDW
ncbi:MAG: hypothetical protein KBH07_09755 [Flavobacteriales bacterium]|nr:hypothetical protein [Flavobacteriales bacterium]MBP9079853.1 hypothetical protein [Flavobacteriales bacterium]